MFGLRIRDIILYCVLLNLFILMCILGIFNGSVIVFFTYLAVMFFQAEIIQLYKRFTFLFCDQNDGLKLLR